jgi:hypothetical protein
MYGGSQLYSPLVPGFCNDDATYSHQCVFSSRPAAATKKNYDNGHQTLFDFYILNDSDIPSQAMHTDAHSLFLCFHHQMGFQVFSRSHVANIIAGV